jgi:hypothetical protein
VLEIYLHSFGFALLLLISFGIPAANTPRDDTDPVSVNASEGQKSEERKQPLL